MNRCGLGRGLSRALIALAAAALPAACGQRLELSQPPLVIRSGDVCVVCGMDIRGEPGPRGEAYVEGNEEALKFGSTRDFFAYVTRADIASRLEKAYVQDTARIDWTHPSDAADSFIDARKAYYVAWQPLPGEMGPTFASFAKRADAEALVSRRGGAVLRFGQITASLVSNLDYRCPGRGSPSFALATRARCVMAPDARARIRPRR